MIGHFIERRAGPAWSLSIVLMLPFVAGVVFFGNLSYGLLSELPDTAASVYGAQAAQRHFPAGEVAPLKVLLEVKDMDFSLIQGEPKELVEQFTNNLVRQKDALGLNSVRSLAAPRSATNAAIEVERDRAVQELRSSRICQFNRQLDYAN